MGAETSARACGVVGGTAATPGAAALTLCSTRRDVCHSHPAATLNHCSSSAKGTGSRSTIKHRNNFYTTRQEAKLKELLPPPPSSQTQGIAGLFLEKQV